MIKFQTTTPQIKSTHRMSRGGDRDDRRGDGFRRPPRDIDTMTSLRVGNLPFQTQHDDLKILFGKYGDIGDIFLSTDRNTGRPRGFAFVRYHDKRDAEDALDALNGRTFDGRDMRISIDEGRPGGPRYESFIIILSCTASL